MKKKACITLILSFTFLFACGNQDNKTKYPLLEGLPNAVILDWNLVVIEAMGGIHYDHLLLSSRIHAMVHIAMHDALNAIAPAYEPYIFQGSSGDADPVAAAASAAHAVLLASFPEHEAMLDEHLSRSIASIENKKGRELGIALGIKAANAILENRKDDKAFDDPITTVNNPLTPGLYQYVPPEEYLFAPQWKTMQTFTLSRYDQFRCDPPASLTSETYAFDFNEIKAIGGKVSSVRTDEQTAIAKFWYEAAEIGWNRIARNAAQSQNLDLLKTARLFALLNMALADVYTASFDSKYHYDFWRPYTAIRAAETDGNPETLADMEWESCEITPPVQDYPSTHSGLGDAAAEILSRIFGTSFSFTTESSTAEPPGLTRSFISFTEAANENAESRVLAGIHFRFSCRAGQEQGRKVGKWTIDNYLRPVADESRVSK